MESSGRKVDWKFFRGHDRNGRKVFSKYDHGPILADLQAQELGFAAIARKHGCSPTCVRYLAFKHGIESPVLRGRKPKAYTTRTFRMYEQIIQLIRQYPVKKLAARSGYDISTIYNYRKGRTLPNPIIIEDLCAAMGYKATLVLEPIHEDSLGQKVFRFGEGNGSSRDNRKIAE